MPIRALTMLNESGDTTICWEEDQDEQFAEIIRKKMAEGITFFVITPRFAGFLPPKRTMLKSPDKAMEHRALSVSDTDFSKMVGLGQAEVVKTPAKPARGARVSRDPVEVAQSESVGVRQRQGG